MKKLTPEEKREKLNDLDTIVNRVAFNLNKMDKYSALSIAFDVDFLINYIKQTL